MTISANTPLLRQVLLADAAISGATGLLMAALSTTLSRLLDLPEGLLLWVGLLFVPYAATLAFLATRDELPHWTVWAVIGCNALWAVDCILVVVSGYVVPNTLGVSFILMQALVVAALGELQFVALRRIGGGLRSYA